MNTWKTFASNVPINTPVQWEEFTGNGSVICEGMLLEFAPYRSTECTSRYGDAGEYSIRVVVQPFNTVIPRRVEITDLKYQIDDQWLNFWQMMSRS